MPESDHIARYCSNNKLDNDKLPRATAFTHAEGDTRDPSGNWLEYLDAPDLWAAIEQLRPVVAKKITIRQSGRFVVMNVGVAIEAVATTTGRAIAFVHKPEDNDQSHAQVEGYPEAGSEEELRIGVALKKLVTSHDVYPGVPTDSNP